MYREEQTRFVLSDYRRMSSVTSMIQRLGWESLCSRGKAAKLSMFCKIQNILVDTTPEQLSLWPSLSMLTSSLNLTQGVMSTRSHLNHQKSDYGTACQYHQQLCNCSIPAPPRFCVTMQATIACTRFFFLERGACC